MRLSDLSIRRPVLAVVMNLLLVVVGIMAFRQLTVRELPNIDPPVVSVEVRYPGASAAVVETRITQIVEDALAGIEGIETIESRSTNGRSDVTVEFSLNREIEAAANDVRDAISRIGDRIPPEADPPEVEKVESNAEVVMWLNLNSAGMSTIELSDYAERYVVDRLSSIDGVAQVRVGGGQRYAMRIWLDRTALAARGLTVNDVESALRRENVELPAGRLEGAQRDFTLRVERGYQRAEDFAALVLGKGENGHLVRLGEVARVELASAERRAYFRGNGQPNIGMGVVKTSTSNALDVARAVRERLPELQQSLPPDTRIFVAFDSTIFIEAAVDRVYLTLIEAVGLVLLVIFVFLGSPRAALVPAVTVPVCLIAAFIGLWIAGFSINLLTLLALVLCIGLVVDDAIVVLENVQRRIDLGEPPLVAAARGTRQVAFAVIATTAVLISVFLPVGFMEGDSGRLFSELSVALAGAVAISAFVALSLTPMMCSKLLRPALAADQKRSRLHQLFERIGDYYRRQVAWSVGHPGKMFLLVLASVGVAVLLYGRIPQELAPPEDRGAFFISVQGPEGAGFDYTVGQMQKVESVIAPYVGENAPIMQVNSRVPGGWGASEEMHTGQAIVLMSPWDERTVSTADLVETLRAELGEIPGVRALPIVRSGLVRSRGQPVSVVLGGPNYEELAEWRDRMLARMEQNPRLFAVDSDYKETRPQMRVEIDRARAADLGISLSELGRTLETMMGARRVTTFVDDGEEYDVILQARSEDRATPSDLNNLYVRSMTTGQLIPVANVVSLRELAEPGSFNRYNRLRAITLSAGLAPGYTLGEALAWIEQVAAEELPPTAQLGYKGESRDYRNAGSAVLFTFALALLVVYLVLAAQFESFAHPLVIMLTVPLAVLGALLGLWLFGSSLNLFSQIGIVMLVGLAAKNGILIVEFANQLRDEGREVIDAVVESATTRLRPIVMTSIATVAGAVPLLLDDGPGSASRRTVAIVVIAGVSFSTLLSLYVVPAFYAKIAPYTRSPEALARKLDQQEQDVTPVGGHA
ncbi:efflux RND transporter permease subunit [Pseudomarimonas salicorniae]|uniref:Efflux RND transporter permease subunit n=1 Tax=Pseudomarimonas salicorniae TaxID=2933270 RepID=A0ABT0GGF2_9GAMM|nr:efflux RND transporter permease subunit [Lysobacter sp. CAU 1642]MCK7593619.1 efflux RND transporter permease subunit [Lysobacter sp. CAU 1642]